MAPFSVAQLKEKASSVKSSSTDKFQSVKGKYYTNRSSTENTYIPRDPVSKSSPPPPPPPPPSRTVHGVSQAAGTPGPRNATPRSGPPPPVRRNTRPDAGLASRVQSKEDSLQEGFKWSSISHEDKSTFFGWLDEFFDGNQQHPGRSYKSRRIAADDSNGESIIDQEPYNPPRSEPNSSAQDLSNFFSPATHWDVPWYSSPVPTPPPLVNSTDGMRTHSMQWRGDTRTLSGGVLFSDLSACWYTVTWTDRTAHDPSQARRTTAFSPRPDALSREELVSAHETYGETVAAFAEGYEGTGQWCARGECWDLANEALKAFEQWDYVPKPLPCIGTTHGHLIYEGNAWGKDPRTEQAGRWRGGDDRIRRGDIVQWRTVKIVDGNRWFTLGDPDHTAIIVCDQQPLRTPSDKEALRPADLGSLEVVEQSRQSPPARQVYKLGGMVSGEVWVYRPVHMEAYLHFSFAATRPEGI